MIANIFPSNPLGATVNVTGDAVVSCIVARSEGQLNEALFRQV